jgi:hypothetical protein
MVGNLAASLSDPSLAARASDELHERIVCVLVDWDDEAKAHRLDIRGDLLAMLKQTKPALVGGLGSGDIFAKACCGGRIWPLPNTGIMAPRVRSLSEQVANIRSQHAPDAAKCGRRND